MNNRYKDIILASASARRRELMTLMGLDFQVIPSQADENIELCAPEVYVKILAEKKARDVALKYPETCVVGADTIVVLDGDIIGKPVDKEDAFNILSRLSGQTHTVYTGIAVIHGDRCIKECDATKVTFADIPEVELRRYIDSRDPLDKAGAYGVQGPFCVNITRIEGSFFTVVGLPVHLLHNMLKRLFE